MLLSWKCFTLTLGLAHPKCIVLHAVSYSLVRFALKLSCFLVFYEKNSNKNNNVNQNDKKKKQTKKMCTIVKNKAESVVHSSSFTSYSVNFDQNCANDDGQ